VPKQVHTVVEHLIATLVELDVPQPDHRADRATPATLGSGIPHHHPRRTLLRYPRRGTTMSVLTLKKLECIKKQDVFSDDIRVLVDGRKVAGDFKMGKNDKVTLNTRVKFTNKATITLGEVDPKSANDVLGSHVVRESQAGTGAHIHHFDARPNFDYLLIYEVSA
jgi:hypothetical protein